MKQSLPPRSCRRRQTRERRLAFLSSFDRVALCVLATRVMQASCFPLQPCCHDTNGGLWYRERTRFSQQQRSRTSSSVHHHQEGSPHTDDETETTRTPLLSQPELPPTARRRALGTILASSTAIATTAAVSNTVAHAGRPELDASGQLFSPRPEMLSGGSQAARGVPLRDSPQRANLKAGQALQTVYETRFIAYLSRFLLTFDLSAHAWWLEQGLGESWDSDVRTNNDNNRNADQKFAEFAESVEVGLADYFVGPYGSYSSLSAAKAGILAAQPAPSLRADDMATRDGFFQTIFMGNKKKKNSQQKEVDFMDDSVRTAKQGVLNLFTLLKARYRSVAAKRQLAILFSFISSPLLQPTDEIRGLLGESDNVTISEVTLVKPNKPKFESDSRTSPRRGGGYGLSDFPTVSIEGPPALGDEYRQAKLLPIMRTTSRVLRIRVLDGGEGYLAAPVVTVFQPGFGPPCQATAILDRQGHVESILVLDPGFGYGDRKGNPPRVSIEPPKGKRNDAVQPRRARAVAELEYEIVGVQVIEGGNGYVKTEPPRVTITPPMEDPDWFLAVQEQPALRMELAASSPFQIEASVSEMRFNDGIVAFSEKGTPYVSAALDDQLRSRLERDPLELLPSSIRPVLLKERFTQKRVYVIPSIARIPQTVAVISPRFRAQDPLFGGVGKVPVTKGATSLKPSEYGRLALSGAVCTVVVRTALNPLELVKTKQQLQNDEELFAFARKQATSAPDVLNIPPTIGGRESRPLPVAPANDVETKQVVAVVERTETATSTISVGEESTKSEKIGTLEMIKYMIALRGPQSLFQSADITFLASLVFGSFGFGATELFRRSFSAIFFSEDGGPWNEVAVLLAAALATVITAFAASPFEVLRVRSMAMLEEKQWTEVLRDFLVEKSDRNFASDDFDWKELREPSDWFPLWSGFAPIVSRELPFAVVKFLTFDLIASAIISFINGQIGDGALPVQVGVGPVGLTVSAASGAVAGIAGAFVSHPADLILTKTSSASRSSGDDVEKVDWRDVVKDLTSQPGGLANLFVGLPARSIFFFLVIGLQFFLYDYVKSVFQVGSEDLSLVLDVFYAVRAGLAAD